MTILIEEVLILMVFVIIWFLHVTDSVIDIEKNALYAYAIRKEKQKNVGSEDKMIKN